MIMVVVWDAKKYRNKFLSQTYLDVPKALHTRIISPGKVIAGPNYVDSKKKRVDDDVEQETWRENWIVSIIIIMLRRLKLISWKDLPVINQDDNELGRGHILITFSIFHSIPDAGLIAFAITLKSQSIRKLLI